MKTLTLALTGLLVALCGCASLDDLQKMHDNLSAQANSMTVQANSLNRKYSKSCESTFFKSDIVNGQAVLSNDPLAKKAVLLLADRNGRKSSCTAVALSSQVLITAAHCVSNAKPSDIKAVFESSTDCPSGAEQKIFIASEKFVIQEGYDGSPKSHADLALIKLVSPIPSDYFVTTLFDGKSTLANDDVVMLGFGITDEKKTDSMVLRTTKKSLKNDSYVKGPIIGFDQRGKTGGFCRGDSGAPLFVNSGGTYKIIGINSFTIGKSKDTECHTASVGMYIPHFKSWIINQVTSL